MTSYQYRKSHWGDKTVIRLPHLHYGISCTGKTSFLYWIRAQHIQSTGCMAIKLQPRPIQQVHLAVTENPELQWCQLFIISGNGGCLYDNLRCHQGSSLHWRHNEHDGASNHQPHNCLLKENIKALRHWPLYGEFTSERWIPCTKGQ